MSGRHNGAKRDKPDGTAYPYAFGPFQHEKIHAVKPKVDLFRWFPKPYDQGDEESCTANAGATVYRALRSLESLSDRMPARAWIYWQERLREGTTDKDEGAMIQTLMAVMHHGVPDESIYPYDDKKVLINPDEYGGLDNTPPMRFSAYYSIAQREKEIRACLGAFKPFLGLVAVTDSLMQATNGIVPPMDPGEKITGYHGVAFGSFDAEVRRVGFQTSWGDTYGMPIPGQEGACDGRGTIPFERLLNPEQAGAFWTPRGAR